MSDWKINFDAIDDNLAKISKAESKEEVETNSSFEGLTLETQREREVIKQLFESGKVLLGEGVTAEGLPQVNIYLGEKMETPIQTLAEFTDEDIPSMDEKTLRDYMAYKQVAIEYKPVDVSDDMDEIDSLFGDDD